MFKRMYVLYVLSFMLLLVCCGVGQASGSITFQIQVVPGFTISGPDNLVFESVAPGQTVSKELVITVWSNVRWELSVKANGEDMTESLHGEIEVEDKSGGWYDLFSRVRTIRADQPSTGPNGQKVHIPFRFTGSYDDLPGMYAFDVEFTVVPVL